MNFKRIKQRWLLSSVSMLIVGTIGLMPMGCSNSEPRSQASLESSTNESQNPDGQPSEMLSQQTTLENTPANSTSASGDAEAPPGQAMYTVDGIQFSYSPADIVVDAESFSAGETTEEITFVQLWIPEDYQQIKSGNFKGDFPPNAAISIHSNPQALSLIDWIQLRPGLNNIQDIQERTIAEQVGLAFTARSLFKQTSIAFVHPQAEKIVLISLKQPNQGTADARYEEAFNAVIESVVLAGS